jgi:hypothetical protein
MNRHHAPERWQALRYGIIYDHDHARVLRGNAFATRIMNTHWEVEFSTANSAMELRKI